MKIYKKFLLFFLMSFLGTISFFIPIAEDKVIVSWLIDFIKNKLSFVSSYIVLFLAGSLIISTLLGRVCKISYFDERHKKDHPIEIIFYLSSFLILLLVYFDMNCPIISEPEIGGQAFSLAYSILVTIIVSGFFVTVIIESGLVEFVSFLIEPFMRKLFKIPGYAAVDCLSSFVSSASVGIYLTDSFYKEKKYTAKEAGIVATCFSVMSVGFMAVLTTMADIEYLYSNVLFSSFIIISILAFICVRIPPLSQKPDVFIDGAAKLNDTVKTTGFMKRFQIAVKKGTEKAEEFSPQHFIKYFVNTILFAQKVVSIMVTPMVIVMSLVTYTSIFDIIGIVIAPVLEFLQLPDAKTIASACIIGITEVSLPVITIIGLDISVKSRFFVVVLSIVQVIYFAESANAMLSSSIPITVKELIVMFFLRTVIAIPLVAVAAHIMVG